MQSSRGITISLVYVLRCAAVAQALRKLISILNPTVLSQNGSGFDTRAEKGLILNCRERLQRPIIGRSVVPEDIQVAIIGAHFEERVLRPYY
jgi:hypothetical protein